MGSQKLMGRDTQMATQPDKEPYSRLVKIFPNPSKVNVGGGNSSLSPSLLVNHIVNKIFFFSVFNENV